MTYEVDSARISIDEGNYFWTGEVELSQSQDGAKFALDEPVTLNVSGEDYKLVVDQRTVVKSGPGDYRVKLSLLSPSVRLIAPRALPITKTWGATTAKAIAEEVLLGYPMQWEILDWAISPSLFAVQEQYPLDIVRTLAEAVGGTVDTMPNGNVRVRYLYPLSVTQYGPGTKDHAFTEVDDVLESTEGSKALKLFNRYRIMNSEAPDAADRLEFKQNEDRDDEGVVYAYPNPWRTTFHLETTRDGVTIGPATYDEREEEETIEIVNGKGSVKYPIYSIVSTDFLDVDLTGVTFTVGGTELSTTNETLLYSLLKVVYKVRSITYSVRGVAGEQAQFLMVE